MANAAGESRWNRSTYPLQASSNGSAQVFPSTIPSEAVGNLPGDRLPKDMPNSRDPAPWHRYVTEDRVQEDLRAPDLRNGDGFSSHQPLEDVQSYGESSTAVSGSQRSISPQSNRHASQSQSGDAEGSSSPVQLSLNSQNEGLSVPSSWARSKFPPRPTTAASTGRYSPLSASTPEEEYEQMPVQVSRPDQEGATPRTLRRTPRSRRIESPIPSAVIEKAQSPEFAENEQTKAAEIASSWTRHPYPLQSTTGGSTCQHEAPPPSTEDSITATTNELDRGGGHENLAAGSGPQSRGMNALAQFTKQPTAFASPPPRPVSKSENLDPKTAQQPQSGSQAPVKRKEWHRQTYPLQAPASNTALRQSPTPPSSPERETELSMKVASEPPAPGIQTISGSKPIRRQKYPLQSPASISNLQHPPSPPSSPELPPEQTSKTTAPPKLSDSEASQKSKSLRRQKYPLQSPASVANLQPERSPPQVIVEAPVEEEDLPAIQSREIELATKVIKQWRRQPYPVQAHQNISPVQRLPTPQPPDQESDANDPSRSIHLPKNLRAVKDAEEPYNSGRTIVVCLEGTGDKFDNDNTNIVHLIRALKKDDKQQVTYYQAGIGTYGAGGLSGGVTAAMDMAVGSGLGLHVRDAYHFLMHSYKEGDKICIFGFSRGAYTARCLAGMIHKIGLLPPRNIEQIPFAYEFYKNDTPDGWKQSADFKKTFCIDVCVYFIGCFDSVASVGFIPRQLPLSSTPTNKARYFRHAMALDERRAKFKICRHQTKTLEDIKKGEANAHSAESVLHHLLPIYKNQSDMPPSSPTHIKHGQAKHHSDITDEEYQRLFGKEAPFDTDVLEVWFAGAHADVGGGAVLNEERHKLAQIPLRWMIRQAFECNTGIIFKTAVLAEFGLDVHTLWPKYRRLQAPSHAPSPSFLEKYEKSLPPRSIRRSKLVTVGKNDNDEEFYHLKGHTDEDWTPEQVEDFYDAMTRINDQLADALGWWILEFWPVQYKVPRAPGDVAIRTGPNLGRYRGVDDAEPNLHWTVRHRMQHLGYKIGARTAPHTTWRTVV